MRHLAAEHSITLAAFAPHNPIDATWTPIREFCADVHLLPEPIIGRPRLAERLRMLRQRRPTALRLYYSASLATLLQQLVRVQAYDLIHVDEPYMIPYVESLAGLAKVMDHMDVEVIKQRRHLLKDAKRFQPYWWLRWLEHFQWRSFEIESLAWFDAHCAVSEHDAAYFTRHMPEVPAYVIPNGVDITGVQFRPDPSGEPTLLYVGSMDYLPNEDAVLWFSDRVWPSIKAAIPQACFVIVGRDPTPEVRALANRPGIQVTGTVPDVSPYYRGAHALVVPLRIAGGTRLKILEAMAAGVPVLSTKVGAEGLNIVSGTDLLTADTPQAFAEQAIRLLNEKNLRTSLAMQARRTVEANYDWRPIGERLVEVYRLAIIRQQKRNQNRDGRSLSHD